MTRKMIALLGTIFLLASLATAQHQTQNYTSEDVLDNYYWQFNDSSYYQTEAELRNSTHTEAIDHELIVELDEGELTTSTILLIGLQSEYNTDELNAAFSIQPIHPKPGQEIIFNGSYSEGDISEFKWDINGNNTTDYQGEIITHSYTNPGTYPATLTAVDYSGETQTATTNIEIGETSTTSGSTSFGSNTEPTEEEQNITITRLPEQTKVGQPITVTGEITNPQDNTTITIQAENQQKTNVVVDPDGKFAENITLTEIGQKQVTVALQDQEKSRTIMVRPILTITDIQSPTSVDKHQNFNICVYTETEPVEPTITVYKEEDILDQKTAKENCFNTYEEEAGNYNYTISAAVGDETVEEQTSVRVGQESTENESTTSRLAGNFFNQNSGILLSGLGLIALLGLALRKRYLT